MKRIFIVVAGLVGLFGFNASASAVAQGDCDGSGEAMPVNIQDVICTINIVLGTAVPPLPGAGSALNPTGILFGGDYPSGNNADCSGVEIGAQDCAFSQGGQSGFDFTKLDAAGEPLSRQGLEWSAVGSEAAGTQWSCVRDNHTGLVWEVKTDIGLHDKDVTYKWGGLTAVGRDAAPQFGTYDDDWNVLVTSSNAGGGLCGATGWRVPKIKELVSIVNYNNSPVMDTHYFPNTVSNFYWSASPYAFNSSNAWRLGFNSGDDAASNRGSGGRVRLVRPGP